MSRAKKNKINNFTTMKKLIPLLFILLFFACSKEEEADKKSAVFEATIDGTVINIDSPDIVFTETSLSNSVTIRGSEDPDEPLENKLVFSIVVKPSGTLMAQDYQFDDCFNATGLICGWFTFQNVGNDPLLDIAASTNIEENDDATLNLTITEVDFKRGEFIKGTFSGIIVDLNTFNTFNTFNVTNGQFDVNIPA